MPVKKTKSKCKPAAAPERTGKLHMNPIGGRMIKGSNFLILSYISLVLLATVSYGADIEVRANTNSNVIGINQQFVLTVEISGEGVNTIGNVELPNTSAFAELLASGGSSQSIQFINGRMSVQKSFSYYYRAKAEGTYEFPPVSVSYKGNAYQSRPFSIQIVKAAPQAAQPGTRAPAQESLESLDDHLFLKAVVNKRRVYQNEQVMVTYKLYFAINVTQIGAAKLPGTAGFWAEEIEIPNPPTAANEVVGGRQFRVAEIKKTALFPNNPGKLVIDPLGLDCDVRVQSRRSRSAFDSFFDDPFFDDPFFGRTVRKTIFSDPIEIEVMPLPTEGRPADFSGAVGEFKLTANVDKDSVATNEAITFTYKVSGSGNIKMLPNPKPRFPNDFQQYDPKVTENISRTPAGISGSKTWEYVLIPRFPGIHVIKPELFSFFNPRTRSYEQIGTRQFDIRVGKGQESYATLPPGSGVSKEEVMLLGQDIRFIKRESQRFFTIGTNFHNSFAFIFLIIFPLVAIGGAIVYRQHLDKLAGNVAYARSRKARAVAMAQLKRARHYLKEDSQKEFYSQVANALLEFLGNKLNIPSAGIITDQVEGLLRARAVNPEIITNYMKCLQYCDYQRFAPSTSKLEEMKKFYQQSEDAIVALEKTI